MATAAGDLVVNLLANTQRFNAPMNAARGQVAALGGAARNTLNTLLPIGPTLAGAFAGGSLIAMAGKSIALAQVQEQAERKLEAVLRATGNAAGFSADELKKYASQLQASTNFGDEAIINAEALLATFKEVKGDVFKDATSAIVDMAAVMDGDLKGTAIQVGKALNDPVAGLSALSRVGVSFTDQQKDMIKTMTEAGDVAGAQRVILQELQSEFGGAAAAMADPMTQLKNTLGDVGELIGAELLPYVRLFASDTQAALTGTDSAAAKTAETVSSVGTAFGVVSDSVDVFLDGIQYGQAIIVSMFASIAEGIAGVAQLAESVPVLGDKFQGVGDSSRAFADSMRDAANTEWAEAADHWNAAKPSAEAAALAEQMRRARESAGGAAGALAGLDGDLSAAADSAKKLSDMTTKLQEQLSTFGLDDVGKTIHDAMQAGATSDQIDQLRAMAEQLDALKQEASAYEDALKQAERIREQTRTPAEAAQAEIDRVRDLFGRGFIDENTATRAIDDQLEKVKDATVKGIDGTSNAVNDALGRFSGAAEAGSAEAWHTIMQAMAESQQTPAAQVVAPTLDTALPPPALAPPVPPSAPTDVLNGPAADLPNLETTRSSAMDLANTLAGQLASASTEAATSLRRLASQTDLAGIKSQVDAVRDSLGAMADNSDIQVHLGAILDAADMDAAKQAIMGLAADVAQQIRDANAEITGAGAGIVGADSAGAIADQVDRLRNTGATLGMEMPPMPDVPPIPPVSMLPPPLPDIPPLSVATPAIPPVTATVPPIPPVAMLPPQIPPPAVPQPTPLDTSGLQAAPTAGKNDADRKLERLLELVERNTGRAADAIERGADSLTEIPA